LLIKQLGAILGLFREYNQTANSHDAQMVEIRRLFASICPLLFSETWSWYAAHPPDSRHSRKSNATKLFYLLSSRICNSSALTTLPSISLAQSLYGTHLKQSLCKTQVS
jgi:hypothetical protein